MGCVCPDNNIWLRLRFIHLYIQISNTLLYTKFKFLLDDIQTIRVGAEDKSLNNHVYKNVYLLVSKWVKKIVYYSKKHLKERKKKTRLVYE